MQRVAVTAMAIVHVTTVKTTVSNVKEAISPVKDIIVTTAPIKAPKEEATGQVTPPRENRRKDTVHATIGKADTVLATIAKVATSKGKVATSLVKADTSRGKAASSLVKAAHVHTLRVTILMRSIA